MNRPSGMNVAMVICRRELIRFARQPAKVGAAIGTPVLLWLLMASGFADSLGQEALGDVRYSTFLLPGVMTLVAVFAAIFASISIIEDRRDGWLQSVLASPAPRWSIAAGKVAGGGLVAWLQAAILLPSVLLLDAGLSVQAAGMMLAGLAAVSVAMAGMGVAFAWKCETTGSFHAVMNLVFMPMWLLSGAFFPALGAASWMKPLIVINPLTWATQAIRAPLLGEAGSPAALGISCGFALVMIVVATAVVARVRK